MSTPSPHYKLQKWLAQAGYGSRREIERMIQAGRIRLNHCIATLGDRADIHDTIHVDGKRVILNHATAIDTTVLIYHKPEGEICSRRDPNGRPTVYDKLPKLKSGRWISVGRLDYNSSGLLLFTTDGQLAHQLMHPASNIDREYACRVLGRVTPTMLKQLREGVMLADGMARFTDIVDGGGSGANHWYYVVIMEGRNREVRRLWESQKIQVSRLKRVRYGCAWLPRKLKRGHYINMSAQAITQLYAMAGTNKPDKG